MEIEGSLDRYYVLKEPELEEQADSLIKRIREQFEDAPRLGKALLEETVDSAYSLEFEKQYRAGAKIDLDKPPLDVQLGDVGTLIASSSDLRVKAFLMPSLLIYLVDSYWYDSTEHFGYSNTADRLLYLTIHHKDTSLQEMFTTEQRCLIAETFLFVSQNHWCSDTRHQCKRVLAAAGWDRYLPSDEQE